jgi:hypothetical protein
MLDAWTALFRPARPAHPGLTDLLHNRGNRLGLVTHGWRNVDAHGARFGGLHPEEIEQALCTAPVLLEEAAVALHAHALRRLPVMPHVRRRAPGPQRPHVRPSAVAAAAGRPWLCGRPRRLA